MELLVPLLVTVVIFALVWWALAQVPIPAPFRWVVNVILVLIAIVVLLQFVGGGGYLHYR